MNAFVTPETTMTPEEAETLVRRLADQTPSGPSVAEVAEALRLPPEQVARMLAEVRATPKATKLRRRTTRRERRVWLLSGICAIALAAGGLLAARTLELGPFRRYDVVAPVAPQYVYNVSLDGTDIGFANFDEASMVPEELPNRIADILREREASGRAGSAPTTTLEAAEKGLKAAREGRWKDVPNVSFDTVEILRPDAYGNDMRWGGAEVPMYAGKDAHLDDAVSAERARRVAEVVEKAREEVARTSPPQRGQVR